MGELKKRWGTPPNPRQRAIPLDFPIVSRNRYKDGDRPIRSFQEKIPWKDTSFSTSYFKICLKYSRLVYF